MRELQTKGIRDIARDWVNKKRERKSRMTEVRLTILPSLRAHEAFCSPKASRRSEGGSDSYLGSDEPRPTLLDIHSFAPPHPLLRSQVEVEGVGTVSVLHENNYSMQQGGISVAHKARAKDQPKKSRMQVPGEGMMADRVPDILTLA